MNPGWRLPARPSLSHVVFDFDGTLSWLRHGWPEIMCGVFLEHMAPSAEESADSLRERLLGEVLALNGQPSVLQCQRFVEIYEAAGGPRLLAVELVTTFQRRLDLAIAERMNLIRRGVQPAADYLVHGALPFLEHLRARDLTLVILSSTIEVRVREEAELLGLTSYFGRHIYGSGGTPGLFQKRVVFERLLAEEGIAGEQLLSFGDGPVELRETKALGGLALGICSDENHNGSGLLDPHKATHLHAAGADVLLPDFTRATELLDQLLDR